MDEKLQEYIFVHHEEEVELNERIQKQESQCKDEFEKSFMKMKKTDEDEMAHLFEFLLEIGDSNDENEKTKSSRGRGSNRGRRRGRPRY